MRQCSQAVTLAHMPTEKATSHFRTRALTIDVDMQRIAHRWECVGVAVHRGAGARGKPLSSRELRSIRFGDLIETARAHHADDEDKALSLDEKRQRLGARLRRLRVVEPTTKGSGPGRKRVYDRDHFVDVASTYATAHSRGQSPTQAVADRWKISRSTAAKWVYRARNEHRLLAPTTRGKPAGETTRRRKR